MCAFGRAKTRHNTGPVWVATVLACVVAASGAAASPPFTTDDTSTQPTGGFEVDLSAQYTRFKGGTRGTLPGLEVDYGITDNLQIGVQAPYNFAQTDGAGSNFGIGDVALTAKYRFIEADDNGWRPSFAFAPKLTLPAGSQARGLGSGQIQGFLPLWVSKQIDPWTLFGGGAYTINPGPGQLNWWYFGVGAVRSLTDSFSLGAELYHSTKPGRGQRDSTGFNIGVIYNISEVHHLMAAVGRNLINARENNEFSTLLNYQLTF